MSMKMYPFPEKCLTGTVDNFARVTTIDESLSFLKVRCISCPKQFYKSILKGSDNGVYH
jgi:hypothetical protein